MGFLKEMFGPSKEEIWQQLSEEIGAEYTRDGFLKSGKVEARVKEWTITLDTYTVSTGKSSVTYTRMRAPYFNADNFRFTLYRRGFFSDIAKFFGMQDISIGDPEFDADFIIKSNNQWKIVELLANHKIRDMVRAQPTFYLTVKDDEGWFKKSFPEGVDELYFQVLGVITDIARLKALYELFAALLDQLCYIGSAYEKDPGTKL